MLEDVVFYKEKFLESFYVKDIYGWCMLVFGVVSYKLVKEGNVFRVKRIIEWVYFLLGIYGK